MSENTGNPLNQCLRSVWQRTQRKHLAGGLLAFARWVVPLFLVAVLVDRFIFLPGWARAIAAVVLLVAGLRRAWRHGWSRLRSFNATRTAQEVERSQGGIDSLLATAVHFQRNGASPGTSPAMWELTQRKAEAAAGRIPPRNVVSMRELKRPLGIASAFGFLLLVLAIVNGPFLAAGFGRLFTPWLAIAYPTKTKIELGAGDLVVKEGAPAKVEIRLRGSVPKTAKLALQTGQGRPRELVLDVNDGLCTYEIASASRNFTYRVKAGDARSDWRQVRVIPAPRLAGVKVDLEFPAYIDRATETIEALTLTVPEETRVGWRLTLDTPIREATLHRDGIDDLPLEIGDDGRTLALSETATASRGYSFSWLEKDHGFGFTSPRYYLQVAADQAPRVELTSPPANLVAMLGRPLPLAIRAHDDHGIGSTTVNYRVNQHEEKTLEVASPAKGEQGDQPLAWDYRDALPDLEVGDTVSFAIQVSDRYPGPEGPHRVRSETRRITFLSREQYLAQIEKQKNRLLSRVQTIYRQQRSAFETVRALAPGSDGYMQACQLEAIRQEMMRDQLKDIAGLLQALLDDLAANGVADAAEGESLEKVRAALLDIAESHIARGATLLRDQSAAVGDADASADPAAAARAVNTAARELAGIVLLRGIDAAQEVYAREARMLAQLQASLRWRTVTAGSADGAEQLAKEQDELARWTGRLVSDLQAGMRYDRRPLAVLRLTRSVKDLQEAGTQATMREAGGLIREEKTDQAAGLQAGLVRALLDAEFSVRLSGSYTTLMRTREQLGRLIEAQSQLRQQHAAIPDDGFTAKRAAIAREQTAIRRRLLTMLLPTVPAPRSNLFDEEPPQAPPVEAMLAGADRVMTRALAELDAGDRKAIGEQQLQAEEALEAFAGVVNRWAVDLGMQTQGLSTLVAATSERLALLEEYETRVIGLLEQTDIAAAEEKKVDGLAAPQRVLAEEMARFDRDLVKQSQAEPDKDIPPLLSRLRRAEGAARAAVEALKKNAPDEAIGHQEQTADALAEAHAVVLAQNERLALLQDLLMFQRSIGFANGYMADIVAEQRDLLAATKEVKPQDVPGVLPLFDHLRRCMADVAPLLDLIAARLDVGTPLEFARADFEDAVISLQAGDKLDAVDAQEVAAESLAEVQARVRDVQTQTGYVAEIVEFLHSATSDAAMMQSQQTELQQKLASVEEDQLEQFSQTQTDLLARARVHGRQLGSATGMPAFSTAATQMQAALEGLESGDKSIASEQMRSAALALEADAEALLAVISMLHGLPSIEVNTETAPELVRLIDVLAVASNHKGLFRRTQVADQEGLRALARRQGAIASRCGELAASGEPHPILNAARGHLADAVAAFGASERDPLKRAQMAADEKLRHFIVEQALILETAVPPAAPQEGSPLDGGPGSDSESAVTAGFISDFVSGEAPKDQQTEWKVLGDRNRAALNQNFARELPLEYRGLLKNYYERIAK